MSHHLASFSIFLFSRPTEVMIEHNYDYMDGGQAVLECRIGEVRF